MTEYMELPTTGLVRINQIVAPRGPIPVSKSTWWAGVKDGRFPKPLKLGKGTTAWRVEDVRALYAGNDRPSDAAPARAAGKGN